MKKIITISDHPLSPSGVGTQTKYVIEALLNTGKFDVVSLGGAVKHQSYEPKKVEGFKGEWLIFPVDGYGNPQLIQTFIREHRPDILYFMTDPRFYEWLWAIDDSIRANLPMVYYHVWDNYPYPQFNQVFYESTDVIATISKVTSDIVQTVAPSVDEEYIPHAVDSQIFSKKDSEILDKVYKELNSNFSKAYLQGSCWYIGDTLINNHLLVLIIHAFLLQGQIYNLEQNGLVKVIHSFSN